MRKRKGRALAALLAALVFVIALTSTAFADGWPEDDLINTSWGEDVVEDPTSTATPSLPVEPDEPAAPLTPEGNMTLVDDTGSTTPEEKQFITVTSKNGNYFYLIIDRDKDGDSNVHFLNQVDEADLLALIEDDTQTKAPAACICVNKCTAGAVNTSCSVCAVSMGECTGKELEPAPPEEPEPEPQENNSSGMLLVLLVLALAGGGAFYYLKFRKKKPDTSGNSDLDDYDYGDEDEDEDDEETEDA